MLSIEVSLQNSEAEVYITSAAMLLFLTKFILVIIFSVNK